MSTYISGTPESVAPLQAQLEAIYNHHPYARIVGSFGRAAMYAAYGWEAHPLDPVRDGSHLLRDIDLMSTAQAPRQELYETGPHHIDTRLSRFIEYGNPPALLHGSSRLEFDPKVARAVIRCSLGFPMRTFSVGTQLHIESLVVNRYAEKYIRSREYFATFAEWVRQNHPNEFLPDEYYEPFRELRRLNEADQIM